MVEIAPSSPLQPGEYVHSLILPLLSTSKVQGVMSAACDEMMLGDSLLLDHRGGDCFSSKFCVALQQKTQQQGLRLIENHHMWVPAI